MRLCWMRASACGLLLAAACGEDDDLSADDLDAWDAAYMENESGKADENGCSGVLVPDRSGFGNRVALTFDDGPNPDTTPDVLDILARHEIKATFFINGSRVTSQAHRDVLDRIVAEGHILANHSHHHEQLSKLSATEVEREIRDTHEIILQHESAPRYFRFPFGASTCATAQQVRGFDLVVTGWHVDSADWCYANGTGGVGFCAPSTFKHVPDSQRDDMLGFTVDQVRAKGGGIVLFHDIHANTAANLEPIIERLKSDGFTFTSIDDTTTFPLLNGVPDPRGFVGDPCTGPDDEVCGFANGSDEGFCHQFDVSGDTFGFCSLDCTGTCPDKSGWPGTFCASLDGGTSGQCVIKAAAGNGNCADIPGTRAGQADRFIGGSAASAATATVCLPSTGATCEGLCGTATPAPGSDPACFCDATCVDRGDCCGDFAAVCG